MAVIVLTVFIGKNRKIEEKQKVTYHRAALLPQPILIGNQQRIVQFTQVSVFAAIVPTQGSVEPYPHSYQSLVEVRCRSDPALYLTNLFTFFLITTQEPHFDRNAVFYLAL